MLSLMFEEILCVGSLYSVPIFPIYRLLATYPGRSAIYVPFAGCWPPPMIDSQVEVPICRLLATYHDRSAVYLTGANEIKPGTRFVRIGNRQYIVGLHS